MHRGKDFEKLGNNLRGKAFPEGRNLSEVAGSDEHPVEGNWNHTVGIFRSVPQPAKGCCLGTSGEVSCTKGVGPWASFSHPDCYQLVITSHFLCEKAQHFQSRCSWPPICIITTRIPNHISATPKPSPFLRSTAHLFSYNEGGAFNFLIDCSPATLMVLAFTAGSLWSFTHWMHLYWVTAGTQGQLLRHFQHHPSPAESLNGDSTSLSSRRGRSMDHL